MLFHLLSVAPEELLARDDLITNSTERSEGVPFQSVIGAMILNFHRIHLLALCIFGD